MKDLLGQGVKEMTKCKFCTAQRPKSILRFPFYVLALLCLCFLTACASTPNSRAYEDGATDMTDYSDFKVENCKLPDGKVVTMYGFYKVSDGAKWQNIQSRKYNEKEKERLRKLFGEEPWTPTGPLSPFFKVLCGLIDKYGAEKVNKMLFSDTSAISYYNVEDLGELSSYLAVGGGVQGCYEDSTGVYLLTICPPKNLKQLQKNKAEQKRHEGQFGYEVAYIPRKMYADVKPVKLNPAKVTPFNPNNIPDSDRNLVPVISSGNGAYYYDNDLANELQWLAVTTACKGIYDMAYTGNFSQKNPTDYYQTKHIKKYLATNDGRASKGTTLFEGICFDYADFAYQELKQNKLNYPRVANFWMVGTFSDPNDIVAYRLANEGEQSNFTINRTPVVVYNHNHIYAHDGATSHAWFWVQATDGIMYWVDPTWTDNSGRPVYGIVRGGREVQLEANPNYCVR